MRPLRGPRLHSFHACGRGAAAALRRTALDDDTEHAHKVQQMKTLDERAHEMYTCSGLVTPHQRGEETTAPFPHGVTQGTVAADVLGLARRGKASKAAAGSAAAAGAPCRPPLARQSPRLARRQAHSSLSLAPAAAAPLGGCRPLMLAQRGQIIERPPRPPASTAALCDCGPRRRLHRGFGWPPGARTAASWPVTRRAGQRPPRCTAQRAAAAPQPRWMRAPGLLR